MLKTIFIFRSKVEIVKFKKFNIFLKQVLEVKNTSIKYILASLILSNFAIMFFKKSIFI